MIHDQWTSSIAGQNSGRCTPTSISRSVIIPAIQSPLLHENWLHVVPSLLSLPLQPLDCRVFIMYTLYNLPEVFILSALVCYFDKHPDYSRLVLEG